MSFPTDVVLTDDTPTDYTYSQISLENNKSIRKDASRDLGTPRTLVISHEVKGSGMSATDRHLVRLNLVEEDTGSDDLATISSSVYVVIEAPRRIVTETLIKEQLAQLVNFLDVSANVDKLLNSEP